MLVLIHGLGGSSAEMDPFRRLFSPRLHMVTPTLLSHGGRPLAAIGGFDAIVADLLDQLDAEVTEPAFFLGYSFGGYLALYLASRFPDRVRGVAAVGAKVIHDGDALDYIRGVMTPERLFRDSPERRAQLEERFGGALLADRLARGISLYERLRDDPPLGEGELTAIAAPVLLISGERDPLASGEEMRRVAALLPNARLGLFPGRAHPLENVPVERVTIAVRRFMRDVERGEFVAGKPIDLGDALVAEGMPQPGLRAVVGKDRSKD